MDGGGAGRGRGGGVVAVGVGVGVSVWLWEGWRCRHTALDCCGCRRSTEGGMGYIVVVVVVVAAETGSRSAMTEGRQQAMACVCRDNDREASWVFKVA